jgi:hypothetical protein
MLVYNIYVIYFTYFSRNLKEKRTYCNITKITFLSCCGVTGNSLFPGSAVKYLENIPHSFSSPELLMCTPLTSSGSNLDNVEQCISLATSKIKLPNIHIGKVSLCLGTNDVMRNRDDSHQINITATQAIYKIKQTFSKSLLCGYQWSLMYHL